MPASLFTAVPHGTPPPTALLLLPPAVLRGPVMTTEINKRHNSSQLLFFLPATVTAVIFVVALCGHIYNNKENKSYYSGNYNK